MPVPGATELVPEPPEGRVYRGSRRVRTSDASPRGRLRLDAFAAYLQDISGDDTVDAALEDDLAWVVRRLLLEVREPARFREVVELATWCSGVGRNWAERRVSLVGERGAAADAAVVWVRIDAESGTPLRLSEQFDEVYGPTAAGRRVSARLQLPPEPAAAADVRPWPLRFTDFDLLGHVNNAAYLAPVEELLAGEGGPKAPLRAEIEFRQAIERGADLEAVYQRPDATTLLVWLRERDGPTYAVARVAAA